MEQLGTQPTTKGGKWGTASDVGASGSPFYMARPYRWTANFKAAVRNFMTSNGMEILSELEDKYDCASVCEVPLFYITKDISEGRPTQECAAGIYHSMKGSYKAEAAFSIICSLTLWVAMTCALMIACQGDDGDSDDKEEGARKNPEAIYAADGKKDTELAQAPAVAINDDEKVGLPAAPEEEKKD
jgi:hypothetical protein